MFSKGKPTAGEPAPTERGSRKASDVPSIVSPDMAVTGNLTSSGDIQVDGRVDGDVDAANLTIGENGAIEGTIRARTVQVHGAVSGEVHAGSVTLAATARIHGDIVHESLAIEAGAYLDGHCRRRDASQQPAAQAESAGSRPKTGKRSGTPLQSGRSANGESAGGLGEEAAPISDGAAESGSGPTKGVQ